MRLPNAEVLYRLAMDKLRERRKRAFATVLYSPQCVGSMSRRGSPYDSLKAESLVKILKVEAVYLAECEI